MCEYVTALDVTDGDIVINQGYRCRVSGAKAYLAWQGKPSPTARYTLNSLPNEAYPRFLPLPYEGMTSGGNRFFRVCREKK